MKITAFLLAAAGLADTVAAATNAFCSASSVKSCTGAIKTTKSRTASLTSWCESVLGCTPTTTTITGDPVTTTITVWESSTYTDEYIETEEFTTETFDYTSTYYTEVQTNTVYPTWTVEKFVVTTKAAARRDLHAKDLVGRQATKTTSICPSAVQKQACTCLITSCPTATKDARETIKEKTTETTWEFVPKPITYTNTIWEAISHTYTESLTYIETRGILSTHTTTVKCTPSAVNPSFRLQATGVPPVNGQYYWAAPQSPRPLSFSIEVAFTPDIDEATLFSLDSENRLITAHKNGTQYANVDPYNNFQIVHLMDRGEIRLRQYNYLRCQIKPASGKFPGGFGELYCLADGPWTREVWNYCPIYKEWFNAPVLIADEFSEDFPPCYPLVWLVKPVCA